MLKPGETLPPRQGTCYGLEIRSHLDFRYLRQGRGDPLEIRESEVESLPAPGPEVQTWAAIPGKRSFTRLHRGGTGAYTVDIGARHRYWLDPTARLILASPSKAPALREMLLWTTPAALAVTHRGDLALHSAVVQVRAHALLLAAPSGLGKSSTAGAFHAAGHRLLADDFGCVQSIEDGVTAVRPGPAVLRLHAESAVRLGLTDLETTYAEGAKQHLELPEARRGSGNAVPLAGIVFLESGGSGLSLRRVPSSEAVSRLWGLSFFPPSEAGRKQCFESLAGITSHVPVWELERPLEWERLPEVVDRLTGDLIP